VEIRNGSFGLSYTMHYAEYLPIPMERLEDLATNSTCAKAPVNLIFLIKKGMKIKSKSILKRFKCAMILKWQKIGLYYKLEYMMYNTELQMEVYLQVLEFCELRSMVFSIFAIGKFICAI